MLLNFLGLRFDLGKDENIPNREFSVNVTAINVRTKDSYRADIQATAYVSINRKKDSKKKAAYFFGEGNEINPQTITNAITKGTEAAIRVAVGGYEIEELHCKREELTHKAEQSFKKVLEKLGLELNEIIMGNIEENENYSANNYFDAQAQIQGKRTKTIQQAIHDSRIIELETQEKIRKKELETEKNIRTEELETEKVIRDKELDIGSHIEEKEIEFEKASLIKNQTIETAKLDQEKEIEVHRFNVEAEIQIAEEEENSRIEKEKIKQDLAIAEENKQLQILQAQVQGTVEMKELQVLIAILKKEQEKLTAEIERAKTEEAVKTAIQEEKADCRHKIAQKAAEAAKEEANALKVLTEAEGERYKLIPPNDSARMAQMIQELAPRLMEKLPELAEALEALAPKAGVLGDSNVYTFPGGNGEGVNQLMLSTSGMLLIKTLMEGKFGQILEQAVKSIKDDNNGKK